MNIRLPIVLLALLAFAQSFILLPAAADTSAPSNQPATVQQEALASPACQASLKGTNLAQLTSTECCKDQKGICGCRAGKIVCCDGKPSKHPGCTCHGDNGFIE